MCVVDEGTLACGPECCLTPGPSGLPELAGLRRGVRSFLRDVAGAEGTDAVLVVNELVSNAVVHGNAPVRLSLGLHDRDSQLWVEVFDAAPRQPRLDPQARGEAGGLGLRLVDALATSWGVLADEQGKTVWADVPLTD
jgi:anti-sigma regulatory factor (Ser/Thr protein kinase)